MKIKSMLPFLGKEEVDKIIDEVIQGKITNIPITSLMPFASRSKIDALFLHEYNTNGKIYKTCLPFVSSKILHDMVVQYIENNDNREFPTAALPFLNSEDVKLLFYYQLKRQDDPDYQNEEDEDKHVHIFRNGKHIKIDSDDWEDDFDDDDDEEDEDEDDEDEDEDDEDENEDDEDENEDDEDENEDEDDIFEQINAQNINNIVQSAVSKALKQLKPDHKDEDK